MTAFIRSLAKAIVSAVEGVASRTSLTATAFDTQVYDGELLFTLLCSAATAGTDPTLDVKLTHCDTSGGSYTDVDDAAYTQVTDAASCQKIAVDRNKLKRYVKVSATFGGTSTPTFVFGVTCSAFPKYE